MMNVVAAVGMMNVVAAAGCPQLLRGVSCWLAAAVPVAVVAMVANWLHSLQTHIILTINTQSDQYSQVED